MFSALSIKMLEILDEDRIDDIFVQNFLLLEEITWPYIHVYI
jgi:hypothetical protein